MKVKVWFHTFGPDARGFDGVGKDVCYVVSSQWELVDRAMRLRRSKYLSRVYVVDRYGNWPRLVAWRTDVSGGSYVLFSKEDVADNDRFDELLGRIWQQIEKLPSDYDRTNNPMPKGFQKTKKD